jgi:acyl-CoA thioesterase FadM
MQCIPIPPPPGAFVFHTECFYDDLDGQMLLHHPRYLAFVERAQQAWLEKVLEAPRFDWRGFPDMYLVVRKLEIEFEASINDVMPFDVVLWCEGLRAATMTTGFCIQSAQGDRVFAYGRRVNCRVSQDDHRPLMWTELFAERFGEEMRLAQQAGLRIL